jgi:hypothetical protein
MLRDRDYKFQTEIRFALAMLRDQREVIQRVDEVWLDGFAIDLRSNSIEKRRLCRIDRFPKTILDNR